MVGGLERVCGDVLCCAVLCCAVLCCAVLMVMQRQCIRVWLLCTRLPLSGRMGGVAYVVAYTRPPFCLCTLLLLNVMSQRIVFLLLLLLLFLDLHLECYGFIGTAA